MRVGHTRTDTALCCVLRAEASVPRDGVRAGRRLRRAAQLAQRAAAARPHRVRTIQYRVQHAL